LQLRIAIAKFHPQLAQYAVLCCCIQPDKVVAFAPHFGQASFTIFLWD
jgi:hypothetical protein